MSIYLDDFIKSVRDCADKLPIIEGSSKRGILTSKSIMKKLIEENKGVDFDSAYGMRIYALPHLPEGVDFIVMEEEKIHEIINPKFHIGQEPQYYDNSLIENKRSREFFDKLQQEARE